MKSNLVVESNVVPADTEHEEFWKFYPGPFLWTVAEESCKRGKIEVLTEQKHEWILQQSCAKCGAAGPCGC